MSFSSDITTYKFTRERLQSAKAEDIATHMQKLLNYKSQQLSKSRDTMKAQADKHQKNVSYEVRNMMWLSDCNIKTTRPSKDLKDKQLGPFWVFEQVDAFYQLNLPAIMGIHRSSAQSYFIWLLMIHYLINFHLHLHPLSLRRKSTGRWMISQHDIASLNQPA